MHNGAINETLRAARANEPLSASVELELAPAAALRQGSAELCFALAGDKSILTRARAKSPLRILSPKNGGTAAWVYTSCFGGGLLAGDDVSVSVDAGPGTATYISTQSATKVYRSDNALVSRQTLRADVADEALLAIIPDPVTCFAGARFRQHQRFNLTPTGSLIVLDWYTSGRHARGERWSATEYGSVNEIWLGERGAEKCLIRDRLRLAPGVDCLGMQTFNCLATLFMVGPRIEAQAGAVLRHINQLSVQRNDPCPVGASGIASDKGIIVRIAGLSTEQVAGMVFHYLAFLGQILGEAPWSRKW